MNRSRVTSVAALQVMICVTMAVIPARWEAAGVNEALSAAALGIIVSQCGLAALWAVAGSSSLLLRALTAAALLCMTFLTSFSFYRRQDPSDDLLPLVVLAACMALAWCQSLLVYAMVSWSLKLRLLRAGEPPGPMAPSQFHLSHLLVTVTVAAMLLGGGRLLIVEMPSGAALLEANEWGWIAMILALMVTFSVVASLAATFALLGTRWYLACGVGAGLVVSTLVGLEVFLHGYIDHADVSVNEALVRNLTAFSWTALSALVLRTGGWSLCRYEANHQLPRA